MKAVVVVPVLIIEENLILNMEEMYPISNPTIDVKNFYSNVVLDEVIRNSLLVIIKDFYRKV